MCIPDYVDARRLWLRAQLNKGVEVNWKYCVKAADILDCSSDAVLRDINIIMAESLGLEGCNITIGRVHKQTLWKRDRGICQYCGIATTDKYVIEHVIPRLRGGVAEPWNLVTACYSCNHLKGGSVWLPNNFHEITRKNARARQLILSMLGKR